VVDENFHRPSPLYAFQIRYGTVCSPLVGCRILFEQTHTISTVRIY